jgi:hypothetical protein
MMTGYSGLLPAETWSPAECTVTVSVVQFDNLDGAYEFGLVAFGNAQVPPDSLRGGAVMRRADCRI